MSFHSSRVITSVCPGGACYACFGQPFLSEIPCPYDAFKVDPNTGKVYIDQNVCKNYTNQCYECCTFVREVVIPGVPPPNNLYPLRRCIGGLTSEMPFLTSYFDTKTILYDILPGNVTYNYAKLTGLVNGLGGQWDVRLEWGVSPNCSNVINNILFSSGGSGWYGGTLNVDGNYNVEIFLNNLNSGVTYKCRLVMTSTFTNSQNEYYNKYSSYVTFTTSMNNPD